MAKGVFGYFSFHIEGMKLSGDYMNWTTNGLEIEEGEKMAGSPDDFAGNFETHWRDIADQTANLSITFQQNGLFELNWTVTTDANATRFRGRGVIKNHALTGFYEMQ